MSVSASKRKGNDKYNAKCDAIQVRPLKPVGEAIRRAAAASGKSLQAYILDAVDRQMAYDAAGEHELDPWIIPNLIQYLRAHGMSEEDILDCIRALSVREG